MAITNILEKFVDARKNGASCEFNGYLEDYLQMISEDEKAYKVLDEVFKQNNDAKILTNFKISISKDAITNQIIRYKDAFKLQNDAIVIPYIIYENKNNVQRALIYYPNEDGGYIFAKGLYYCLTEPTSQFIDNRNEFVAISSDDPKEVATTYGKMFTQKPGSLQRYLDKHHFGTYEDMHKEALRISNKMHDEAFDKLKDVEDKYEMIREYIVKWFLLKKVLYVQYMLNKDFLQNVHEGNVRKQRNQAKINADEIAFISYSSLWRGHE